MTNFFRIILPLIISSSFSQSIQYFSGDEAMKHLVAQCDLGPRYPGSEGHFKAQKLFIDYFSSLG